MRQSPDIRRAIRDYADGNVLKPPTSCPRCAKCPHCMQRQLGEQLISIGYKILARTLHPDKPCGSREAMARLNIVRDRLNGGLKCGA